MKGTTLGPDLVMDVKGEMCPVPLMRAMVAMKRLKDGQVLAVITDHVPSTQSIPENLAKKGHQVLAIEDLGARTFRISVKR